MIQNRIATDIHFLQELTQLSDRFCLLLQPAKIQNIKCLLLVDTHFLHMVQLFLGAGLCEKADRQVVEQNRCVDPLRWYAVCPFFSGFLQLAQVTWYEQTNNHPAGQFLQ